MAKRYQEYKMFESTLPDVEKEVNDLVDDGWEIAYAPKYQFNGEYVFIVMGFNNESSAPNPFKEK